MDIVLFGIQGSGKGTQAKRLAEEYGFYIFEAGGELRKMAASGSELGNIVKSHVDEGHLVPFGIIMQVVKQAIDDQPADQMILFDGIPRDRDQKRTFDEIMAEAGREFTCFNILLDENEAFKRILDRSKQENRADDADESKIRRRFDLFRERTIPAITEYYEAGNMHEIDGGGSVDDVYDRLSSAIDSVLLPSS